ncbi:MAG: response regulator [Cyanobacteria bacterium J06635_1]
MHELDEGELTLDNGASTWKLHLSGGQLIYPVDEFHRVRRWDRAVREQRLNWHWHIPNEWLSASSFWELLLFEQGFAQQRFSPLQAKLIIRSVVQECFFELSRYAELQSVWKPMPKPLSSSCKTAALSARELQMLYHKAASMQQEWQSASFVGGLSPNLAPMLTQAVNSESLPVNPIYLTGQFNFWDISLWVGRSLAGLARALLPLAEHNCLQFNPLSDLSGPAIDPTPVLMRRQSVLLSPPAPASLPADRSQALIACIDDSPVLAHKLRTILESAGYPMISIQEPMRGFSILIEHKPDLILLDLNLPNADGYSICKFLRDSPVFKKTPIIILTGQDTHADRLKAQSVGATEFLTKPPQPQALLEAIQKFSATEREYAITQ